MTASQSNGCSRMSFRTASENPARIHHLEASTSQPLSGRTWAGGNLKFSARLESLRPGQPLGSVQGFPTISRLRYGRSPLYRRTIWRIYEFIESSAQADVRSPDLRSRGNERDDEDSDWLGPRRGAAGASFLI